MTAIDGEIIFLPNIKIYFSWLVDEMDVESLEENGNMNRNAYGLQFGIKIYTTSLFPFHP